MKVSAFSHNNRLWRHTEWDIRLTGQVSGIRPNGYPYHHYILQCIKYLIQGGSIRIKNLKERQACTCESRKYQYFTSLLASLLPNGTLPPVANCNIYEPSSKPSPRRLNKVNRARTYLRHLPMKVCKLRLNPTLRAQFYCHSTACKPTRELYVIT